MTAPVYSVSSLSIATLETQPPKLAISVSGQVSTPGWTNFKLVHRVYIVPPADGIYEADAVGTPPGGMEIEVLTPFHFNEIWSHFPPDLTGLKVYAATNSIMAASA